VTFYAGNSTLPVYSLLIIMNMKFHNKQYFKTFYLSRIPSLLQNKIKIKQSERCWFLYYQAKHLYYNIPEFGKLRNSYYVI